MTETLWHVYQQAARELIGQPCQVRFETPSYQGANGEISRDERGRLYIKLAPWLSGQELIKFFLHEAAHGKIHPLVKSDFSTALPGSVKPPANYGRDGHETQADQLAARWLALCGKTKHTGRAAEMELLATLLDALQGAKDKK